MRPADILAAQANGIRAIAVATGLTAEEELRKLQPDILLKDLRALRLAHGGGGHLKSLHPWRTA